MVPRQDELIADRFCAWAESSPEQTALAIGRDRVTYGDLAVRARRVAHAIAPSARVALLLPNGIALVEAFLGAVLVGAATAVLDPEWTDEELTAALADLRPGIIVTTDDLFARVAGIDAAGRAKALICTDDWYHVSSAGTAVPADLPRVSPEAPFYIGFTSGTTGAPKAYRRSHRSWLASLDAAAAEFPVTAGDRVLIPGPLPHSMFLYALIETLSAGATAHLLARFQADAALAVLERERVTRLHAVPTMLAAVADTAEARDRRAGGLRTLVSAGDKLRPDLRKRVQGLFPQTAIFEYYGASELSFVSVAPAAEGWPAESVGRPFRGVAVDVRRDDGSPAPAGAIGRLWVQSDMVCSGYLRPRDDDGFRMHDGWATVGDLARRDATGVLFVAGREGGMVVTGGRNVYPAEVEAVLRALPEVAEAIVIGLPEPHWGASLCAVLRWRNGARMSAGDLAARCRQRLSRYKCPRQYFVIDRFPYTPSGKIAAERVRERLLADPPDLTEVR